MSISEGNLKLENIPNWSLPPIVTCPHHELCGGRDPVTGKRLPCYVDKAWRLYPSARQSWNENLRLAKSGAFVDVVEAYIHKHRPPYFRIHVAGDFYNERYLHQWFRICKGAPDTKFLAFTKAWDWNYSHRPANLEVIVSMFQGQRLRDIPKRLHSFPRFYTGKGFRDLRFQSALKCSGFCSTCLMCWHARENQIDVRADIH